MAGLFSPYSLYRGGMAALTDNVRSRRRPAAAMTAAYFVVMVLVAAAGLVGLVVRYRRIAGR